MKLVPYLLLLLLSLSSLGATAVMRSVAPLASCLVFSFLASATAGAARVESMPRLAYNNPGTLADLGVGLGAWPLPLDYHRDGLMDLVVVCTDKPSNCTWHFENSGEIDAQLKFPIFQPAVSNGESALPTGISCATGKVAARWS
jgi:hypothetical protein